MKVVYSYFFFILICAIGNVKFVENCGTESRAGLYFTRNRPYLAGLFTKKNNVFICSGTIIHKQWILTAAHCIHDYKNYELYIRVGTNQTDMGGQKLDIYKLFTHPLFERDSLYKNYAMLGVGNRMMFDINVRPIKWADPSFDYRIFQPGLPVLLVGFGKISHTVSFDLNLLMNELELKLIELNRCISVYTSPYREVNYYHLCMGATGRHLGCCYADSGGPAVYNDTLIGITMLNRDCANLMYPTVVARVDLEHYWIEDVIDKN